MLFTLDDVRQNFDVGTYGRGDDYERRGKVRAAAINDSLIEGSVGGSGGQLYRQSIAVLNRPRGVDFDGDCSCPVSHNCKHVVAVLLTLLQQGRAAAPRAAALPYAMSSWVEQMAQAAARGRGAADAARPGKASYRLAYVLIASSTAGCIELYLCKGRLGPDGGIRSASVLAETFKLFFDPPDYVRHTDRHPARLFHALRDDQVASHHTAAVVAPCGELGAQLLRLLADENCLLWADSRADLQAGPIRPLVPGPPRDGSVQWAGRDDTDDALRLGWRFTDGGPIDHVLPTAPALYFHQGMLGELTLPVAAQGIPIQDLIKLVAQAQRVTGQERYAVAQQMAARVLDRVVPPPAAHQRVRTGVAARPCLMLGSVDVPDPQPGREQALDFAVLAFDYDDVRALPGRWCATPRPEPN